MATPVKKRLLRPTRKEDCLMRGGFLGLYFVAGIYFFARGVFALFGQTLFYTKRALEQIDPSDLPAYLKQIGICHIATGVLFVGKAILDVAFPFNRAVSIGFIILLVVCIYFLAKTNEKYIKRQ